MAELNSAFNRVCKTFKFDKLNKHQQKAIELFINQKRDIVVTLPTGYGTMTERTIIYCQTIKQCGKIYNSIKSMLGNHLYIGQAGNARNVVLEMLHYILEMLHSSI